MNKWRVEVVESVTHALVAALSLRKGSLPWGFFEPPFATGICPDKINPPPKYLQKGAHERWTKLKFLLPMYT